MPIVCISGGFDPIHCGHIELIQQAAKKGDVFVILNSDDWLKRKKGYVFLDWEHRAKIIRAIHGVEYISRVDDSDGTVCEALRRIKPDYFANGGDRNVDNTPEQDVCRELNIRMLWGIGGSKMAGSQDIVKAAFEAKAYHDNNQLLCGYVDKKVS